jgi:hypothetical protein
MWMLLPLKSWFVFNLEVYLSQGIGGGPHGLAYEVVIHMVEKRKVKGIPPPPGTLRMCPLMSFQYTIWLGNDGIIKCLCRVFIRHKTFVTCRHTSTTVLNRVTNFYLGRRYNLCFMRLSLFCHSKKWGNFLSWKSLLYLFKATLKKVQKMFRKP